MNFENMSADNNLHCRIGSLEMTRVMFANPIILHCRIGSLEKLRRDARFAVSLHCRIGSLEKSQSR